MHPDLRVPRRVLLHSYEVYVIADRDWRAAQEEAALFLPDLPRRRVWQIGAPQSRLRKLYDARSHAVETMTVARIKLRRAQERVERRMLPAG